MKKGVITEIWYKKEGYQEVKINGKTYVAFLDLIKFPDIKIGEEVLWDSVSAAPTYIPNTNLGIDFDLITVETKKKK